MRRIVQAGFGATKQTNAPMAVSTEQATPAPQTAPFVPAAYEAVAEPVAAEAAQQPAPQVAAAFEAMPEVKPVTTALAPGAYKIKGGWKAEVSVNSLTISRGSVEGADRVSGGTFILDAGLPTELTVAFGSSGSSEEGRDEQVNSEPQPPQGEPSVVDTPVAGMGESNDAT